jgi:hypothetical protein
MPSPWLSRLATLKAARTAARGSAPHQPLMLLTVIDGRWEMGDGRWEMGDGRWEMGDGRWEMGDGRWEMGDGRWRISTPRG